MSAIVDLHLPREWGGCKGRLGDRIDSASDVGDVTCAVCIDNVTRTLPNGVFEVVAVFVADGARLLSMEVGTPV